jgi:hypothetical protein
MIFIQPSPTLSLRSLFNLPHLGFVMDAITAGNSPGAIWVDDPTAPRSAFVWDTTHSLYLGGDANNQLSTMPCADSSPKVFCHKAAKNS